MIADAATLGTAHAGSRRDLNPATRFDGNPLVHHEADFNSRANRTKLRTTASKMMRPFSFVARVGSPLIPDFENLVQ